MPMSETASVPALIRGLQERSARALPPVVSAHLDGWWLRQAGSGAWWASAVLPHGDAGPAELPARIRIAEEFCARHGAPARFQVSPGACPAGLDDALAGRGYCLQCPMSLRTAPATRVIGRLPAGGARICIDDQPADAWFGKCGNTAARRLYGQAGFTQLCRYHYRTGGRIC